MKKLLFLVSVLTFASLPMIAACAANEGVASRPNILFIAIDDWKPLAGIYGDSVAITPSIDAIAAQSTVFTRAYVQYPVCGPSRASMLTGLRPELSGILDLKTRMRDIHPDILTLPEFFKNAGYETAASGKIFDPRNVDSRDTDDPRSWSIPYKRPIGIVDKKRGPNFVAKAIDALPSQFVDGAIHNRGIKLLRRMATSEQPFFLAVGYKKPHMPFVVPKSFFDLYDKESFALVEFQQAPRNSDASYILGKNSELRNYWPTPRAGQAAEPYGEQITTDQQREILHGYYAATSFIDSLVGELLSELKSSGVASNTIIVLWGDHGFHLGDHGKWGKHTTMEEATRIPMMIHVPGMDGGESVALVESLDLFPTLAELAGLDIPAQLQGRSLIPVLEDATATVKTAAISQYKRLGAYGYSMRTDRYRYTEWVTANGKVVYRDLYDMHVDPGEKENIAVVDNNEDLLNNLAARLRAHKFGLKRLQ